MIVTPLVETVRFCQSLGDPYNSQCTIQWLSPTAVNICNLSGSFTRDMHNALYQHLADLGVNRATYVRFKNGQWIEYEIPASKQTPED